MDPRRMAGRFGNGEKQEFTDVVSGILDWILAIRRSWYSLFSTGLLWEMRLLLSPEKYVHPRSEPCSHHCRTRTGNHSRQDMYIEYSLAREYHATSYNKYHGMGSYALWLTHSRPPELRVDALVSRPGTKIDTVK